MSKLKSLHGVKVKHFKNTEDCSTEILPIPDRVVISMSQHIGKPCDPTVKITDLVKVGQVIGTSDAFISAPIHSSVSGKVVAVDEILMSNGQKTKAVTIETDKLQEVDESVVPDVYKRQDRGCRYSCFDRWQPAAPQKRCAGCRGTGRDRRDTGTPTGLVFQ